MSKLVLHVIYRKEVTTNKGAKHNCKGKYSVSNYILVQHGCYDSIETGILARAQREIEITLQHSSSFHSNAYP